MKVIKVITYQTPSGDTLDLTRAQAKQFTRLHQWPRNGRGEEYCQVSRGLHVSHADLSVDPSADPSTGE